MKSQVDKRKVMIRAWAIFRGKNPYSGSFSESLKRAWFVEKVTIEYNERLAIEAQRKAEADANYKRWLANMKNGESKLKEIIASACQEYYESKQSGQYCGD